MKYLYKTLLALTLVYTGCMPPPQKPHVNTPQEIATKNIVNKFIVTGEPGVKLEVEIEYAVGSDGYINNGCVAQYIVTNIGTKEYRYLSSKQKVFDVYNKLVFEFQTSDGKVIQESVDLWDNLGVGKSLKAREIKTDVGLNRFCTGVKAVRMDKR